jgi:hypothetical protein
MDDTFQRRFRERLLGIEAAGEPMPNRGQGTSGHLVETGGESVASQKGGPMPAAPFTAVLVSAASATCAPLAATAPLAVVAPTAPIAAQPKPPPGPTACATPTTKGQHLAAAHAAVREMLVSNKKKVIEAGRTLTIMHRGPPPEDAENVDEAKNAAAEKADEAENAKFDAALAAVDGAESQGKGPASDDAKRIELGGALVFVQVNPGDSGDGCAGGDAPAPGAERNRGSSPPHPGGPRRQGEGQCLRPSEGSSGAPARARDAHRSAPLLQHRGQQRR